MTRAEEIAAALREVRQRISAAALRAGRAGDAVRLIAVSKRMPPDDVRAALAAGQQDFGENYAQELRDKRAALEGDPHPLGAGSAARPRWHYLGPIQSNKVKYLAGQVELIQSVQDADTLAEIDRRMAARDPATTAATPSSAVNAPPLPDLPSVPIRQPCLVQVNVAGETRKGGVPPHRLGAFLDRFATSTQATCVGLMLIPPLSSDVEATRQHFAALRALAAREGAVIRPNVTLSELSMGMSGDFEAAIAEGATMVRVGTAIFGERGHAPET